MEYETDEDGYSYTNTGGDVSGGEIIILLNEYVKFVLNEWCFKKKLFFFKSIKYFACFYEFCFFYFIFGRIKIQIQTT